MKRTFLLDENVFIAAETVQNERKQDDRSSADLVEAIVGNCHALVVSLELFAKYSRKANAIGQERAASGGVRMMPLLKILMVNPEKCRFVPPQEIVRVPDENSLPADDIFLIRLAVPTNAVLVTADNRLIQRLADRGGPPQAARPEDALPLAHLPN